MPFGMSATIKSQYSGPVCDLCIGGQYFLSVTPRHPIPTHNGMVAAGDLKKGDVVYVARSEMIGRYTGVAEYLHAAAKATHETIYEEPRPGMLHGEAATMVDPLEIAMIPGTRPSPEMETNDAIVRALKHKSIQYTPASVTFNHRRHYEGPVYDFSAQTLPFYIAGGILVSNCRCWLSWSEVLNP